MTKRTHCANIILAEDNDSIRECLVEILKIEGYRVYPTCNAKEALELLKTVQSPCLIVTDLMMPVMNGFELLTLRKKDKALSSIPILVISAAGDSIASSIKGLASEFIKKPLDMNLFLEAVKKYCK